MIALIAWLLPSLWAQQFRVQVQGSDVQVDEPFEVAFVLTGGEGKQVQFPMFDRLTKISGPTATQEMVNLQGTLTTQTVYRFEFKASRPGTYLISTATAQIGTEILSTSPVEVQVVAPVSDLTEEDLALRRELERSLGRSIRVEARLSSTRIYAGEPVELTYDLWIEADLAGQVGNISREGTPQFPGFSVTTIPSRNERTLEFSQGKRYIRTRISTFQLIPQAAGTVFLDSLPVAMTIAIPRAGRQPQNELEVFQRKFQPDFRDYRYQIASGRKKLEVLPLPAEGRPLDFSGLVGSLELDARLADSLLETGMQSQIVLAFRGEADFGLLIAPALSLPPGLEGFPPEIVPTPDGKGRQITYSFVARTPGTFSIPVPVLSFFDPVSRSFRQLGGDSLRLLASGEALVTAVDSAARSSTDDLTFSPVLFPMRSGLRMQAEEWVLRWSWELMALPWLLFSLGALLWRRYQRKLQDPVYQQQRRLRLRIDSQRHRAQKAVQAKQPREAGAALLEAMWAIAEERLNLPRESHLPGTLAGILACTSWPRETQDRYLQAIHTCQTLAYGHAPAINPRLVKDINSLIDHLMSLAPPLGDPKESKPVNLWPRVMACAALMVLSWMSVQADPSFDAAEKAYQAHDYGRSATIYDSLYRAGERSLALFHNWGNAAYQRGDLGRSVWAFEKGLRHEPTSKLTRSNLSYVQRGIRSDILPRPELNIERSWREIIGRVGPSGWSWLAICFSTAMALMMGLSLRWSRIRAWRLRSGLALGIGLILCIWLRSVSDPARPNGQAIVILQTVIREAPEGQRELLTLSPGIKVYMGERISEWQQIRVQDPESGELVGFVPSESVAAL